MTDQITKALLALGIRVEGSKVKKKGFRKVFGGTFVEPEWVVMNDYKVEMPYPYIQIIEKEDSEIGRALLPSTFSITRYGEFLDEYGNSVILDGMVYQYSMAKNPRNVHYAYRLFLDGETINRNSDLPSVHTAKQECSDHAEDLIKTELYDIS